MSTLVEQLQPELLNIARKQSFKEGFEKASEQLRPKFLQEGRQEGRQEGHQEGQQEGRQEERIKIAKNMLSEGIDIKVISLATKLSEKEIKKLVH